MGQKHLRVAVSALLQLLGQDIDGIVVQRPRVGIAVLGLGKVDPPAAGRENEVLLSQMDRLADPGAGHQQGCEERLQVWCRIGNEQFAFAGETRWTSP